MECKPKLVAMAEQTLARGEEAVIAGASIIPQANVGVNGSRSKRNLIGVWFSQWQHFLYHREFLIRNQLKLGSRSLGKTS